MSILSNDHRPKGPRGLRRPALWILLVLVAIGFLAYPVLEARARRLVLTAFEGHMDKKDLEKVRLDLHLLQGRIVVYDLVVDPTAERDPAGPAKARFTYTVPRIELDIGILRLMVGRVQLESIVLERPVITVEDVVHQRSAEAFNVRELLARIRVILSGYLTSVGVSNMVIDKAAMRYTVPTPEGPWDFQVDGLDLEIRGLVIDQDLLNDPGQLPLEEFRIGLGPNQFTTANGKLHLELDRFDVSLAERKLEVAGLKVGTSRAVAGREGPGSSPLRMDLDSMSILGFQLHHTMTGDTLVARRIAINGPDVHLEIAPERENEGDHGKDPMAHLSQMLGDLLPEFRSDTLLLRNGSLSIRKGGSLSVDVRTIDVELHSVKMGPDPANGTLTVQPPKGGTILISGTDLVTPSDEVHVDHLFVDVGQRAVKLSGSKVSDAKGMMAGVDEFQASGLDVAAWLRNRDLVLDSLTMAGLRVEMMGPSKKKGVMPDRPLAPSGPVRIPIGKVLKLANIPSLLVSEVRVQGSGKLRKGKGSAFWGSVGRFVLRMRGLRYPEGPNEPHRTMYADGGDVVFEGVELFEAQPAARISMGRISLASGVEGVDIRELRIGLVDGDATTLSADLVQLKGVDYLALVERRGVFIRTLRTREAELVLTLPNGPGTAREKDVGASMILKHLRIDTVDIRTRSLNVVRSGSVLARMDDFFYTVNNVRPDLEAWTDSALAFRFNDAHYGGKNARVEPPGTGLLATVRSFEKDIANDRAQFDEVLIRVNKQGLEASVSIPLITSTDFDPLIENRSKVIDLGHLVLSDPRLDIKLDGPMPGKVQKESGATTGHEGFFTGLHARAITIRNAKGVLLLDSMSRTIDVEGMDGMVNDLDLWLSASNGDQVRTGSVDLLVNKVSIGRPGGADTTLTSRGLYTRMASFHRKADGRTRVDGLHFGAGNLAMPLSGGDLLFHCGVVDYSHDEGSLSVNDIHVAPRIGQESFASEQDFRTDALILDADHMVVTGLDAGAIIEERHVHIPHLRFDGVAVNDLRDHRLPFEPYRYKPLLSRVVYELDQDLRIDTVDVRDATVNYAEIGPRGKARISLTEVNAQVLNMGTKRSGAQGTLVVQADGLVEDKGRFHSRMEFDLGHERDLFSYHFSLGRMDLTSLNGMIEPVANMSIVSGHLDTLYLTAEANDDVSIGAMRMYYRKLHIKLLDRQGNEDAPLSMFGSWVANALVRTDHRPKERSDPAAIYFERLKDRSLFNYVIKQTQSGVPGNLRLPDKKGKVKRSDELELKQHFDEDSTP